MKLLWALYHHLKGDVRFHSGLHNRLRYGLFKRWPWCAADNYKYSDENREAALDKLEHRLGNRFVPF
jgi:hypothetical protein